MRIIALRCDQCGAPLDVPADPDQITCRYCGCGLHVSLLRSASADSVRADPISAVSPEERQLVAELDQLDDEWESYRAKYLPKDGSGEYFVPEPEVYRLGAWVMGILAVGVTIACLLNHAPGLLLFPLIIGIGSVAHLLHQAKVGEVYARSVKNYRHERLAIVRRLTNTTNS